MMTMPYPESDIAISRKVIAKNRRYVETIERLRKGPELVPFAKAVPKVDTTTTAVTTTYIPDYLIDRMQEPEKIAEKQLDIDNLVDVDEHVLDVLKTSSIELTDELKHLLLNEGAAMLISFDDASSYTEVVLRDGMGIEVDIDSSITHGIGQLMRLNVLHSCISRLSLPQHLKDRFLNTLTHKLAEEAFNSMQKASKSEKYSTMLKNLQARINGKYSENVGNVTPVGVVKRRSSPPSADPNAPSDQLHEYNEQQHKGVRYE